MTESGDAPCPFCGGAPVAAREDAAHVMACTGCGARGPRKAAPEAAAAAWNARPGEPAPADDAGPIPLLAGEDPPP